MHPLVDAFWKGRQSLKRGKGEYFDKDREPKKACAVGAIYYGLYKSVTQFPNAAISNLYPEFRQMVNVPCEHDDVGSVIAILIHLNDQHSAKTWNDANLAKWLEIALQSDARV